MTLAEFITARLGEDEAVAKAALEDAPRLERTQFRIWVKGWSHQRLAQIDRFDAARVLRQVTAMRAILGDWEAANGYDLPEGVEDGRDPDERIRDEQIQMALEDAACHLAAIWSDHPDYREEWKP